MVIELKYKTDPQWAHFVLKDFDKFLQNHANCERKASAMAMSFVMKYSDKKEMIPELIALAQEELEHFRQVYAFMAERDLPLEAEEKDPYVVPLIKFCRHGREERFIDRMLVASIVEARGAERFRLIYQALEDPELKAFYKEFWISEARHGTLFVKLLEKYYDKDMLRARLGELLEEEAKIVEALPWRHCLH